MSTLKKVLAASYDRKALIEKLADLEHEQWMEWSKAVAPDIKDQERVERWKNYWVPYDQLDSKTKDMDREWADKVMEIIEPLLGAQQAREMVTKVEVDGARYPELAKLLGDSHE